MTARKTPAARHASLLAALTCLTVLCIAAQLSFFIIHYKVSELVDSLIQSSLGLSMLHFVILKPLLIFIIIQAMAYGFLILWVWFTAQSIGELWQFSSGKIYCLGIFIWLLTAVSVFLLNNYFYPHSFFATLSFTSLFLIKVILLILATFTLLAYYHAFTRKRRLRISILLLAVIGIFLLAEFYPRTPTTSYTPLTQPNIIIIGLDSVRPDFVGYFSPDHLHLTPHLNDILHSAAVFTEAYTPLARTFPSWVSILTGKYPKHNDARTNLADTDQILKNVTLAEKLRAAGYQTIYATDEKRFSNVTEQFGFDQVLGPNMGVNDFVLGGLSDFPLTNLLVNTSLGHVLFPFNFANRAAAITYEPQAFLQLIQQGLARRTNQPLFLAIHLCLSHWPYTWANSSNQMVCFQKNMQKVSSSWIGNLTK